MIKEQKDKTTNYNIVCLIVGYIYIPTILSTPKVEGRFRFRDGVFVSAASNEFREQLHGTFSFLFNVMPLLSCVRVRKTSARNMCMFF